MTDKELNEICDAADGLGEYLPAWKRYAHMVALNEIDQRWQWIDLDRRRHYTPIPGAIRA
jgi:hypothetical protein